MSETRQGSTGSEDSGSGFRPLHEERRVDVGLIGAIVVAVALLIFILQNTEEQEVTWLFFDAQAPLWVLIVVTAVLSVALSQFILLIVRRRRRKSR